MLKSTFLLQVQIEKIFKSIKKIGIKRNKCVYYLNGTTHCIKENLLKELTPVNLALFLQILT